MFLPIDIKIEVGEIVGGYSLPYKDQHGLTQMDFVKGLVEKIDEKNKKVKVAKYPEMLEETRIEWFTFGGVAVPNKRFNQESVWNSTF